MFGLFTLTTVPLIVQGEGYRDFSEPRFFECETLAQVRMIRNPTDKAHALVGSALVFYLYKFDGSSALPDNGSTVLTPSNPEMSGRWLLLPAAAAGGGSTSGAGTPEGVVISLPGALYWDALNKILYVKDTGVGSTGWRELIA